MNNKTKKTKRRPATAPRHAHLRTVRTLPALDRALAELRKRHKTVALVPTMGALHAGHLALVRLAQRRAGAVAVSIFVNPAQFAPHEDLNTYPRTFDADLAALWTMNADLVWAPAVEIMYPQGFATAIVPGGAANAGLEDQFRPHFFTGVATVVAKLLLQCEPDIAVFGEKDYQQLKVVTALARDLGLKTRIVGAPIVREPDGLALSSRNRYLAPAERAAAPALYRALKDCAAALAAGETAAEALSNGRQTITNAGFALDYLEARNAETLAPLDGVAGEPIRLLVAARIGTTRLIDNVAVKR